MLAFSYVECSWSSGEPVLDLQSRAADYAAASQSLERSNLLLL